jgi:hypothetical protein
MNIQEDCMRKFVLSAAIAAAVGAGSLITGTAQAAPAGPLTAPGFNLVEKTQFVFGGRNYCFDPAGWRGPGWYWCGYSHRRGYGWGGPSGWHGWRHGGHHRGYVSSHRGHRDYGHRGDGRRDHDHRGRSHDYR